MRSAVVAFGVSFIIDYLLQKQVHRREILPSITPWA
jgi:hypothetical protein